MTQAFDELTKRIHADPEHVTELEWVLYMGRQWTEKGTLNKAAAELAALLEGNK